MPPIRSFIAIELPDTLKNELSVLEAGLKKRSPDVVKWVDQQSMHLTLKFLGAVPEENIEEILMAIEEAAVGIVPFSLELRGVGAFPNLNRVQVIWAGVYGEIDKLAALQKMVDNNTAQLGFPGEERAFSPHLTLGRVRNYTLPEERQKIGKILADTSFAALGSAKVQSVSLMKSQLTPHGAVYSRLGEIKLKPPEG